MSSVVKFVVIGGSGHGKSTVLNELADANLFDVAGGSKACTQIGGEWEAKNTKTVSISTDGNHTHRVELVDTPGFPATDPANTRRNYDHVIAKCNAEINGVLFVIKPERECGDVMVRHAVLLKQFVHLRPPLIILVNGTEFPGKHDPPSKREVAVKDFRAFGREIERRTGLQARELLVSYCLDEVHGLAKEAVRMFASAKPQASSLLTLAEIQARLGACKSSEEHIRHRMGEAEAKKRKCEDDIASLEQAPSSRRGRADELRAALVEAERASAEAGDPEQCRAQARQLDECLRPKAPRVEDANRPLLQEGARTNPRDNYDNSWNVEARPVLDDGAHRQDEVRGLDWQHEMIRRQDNYDTDPLARDAWTPWSWCSVL